jgi:hypothetical protein
MSVVWLMMWIAGVGSAPVHVGNFPDVATCIASAKTSQTTQTNAPAPDIPRITWVCVPANTGHPNDPPPPA